MYPLLFEIFKPRSRLPEGDEYTTEPELAVESIHEVQAAGFKVQWVLADSFYGESSSFIDCVKTFEMLFIVAIRSNHGVLMPSWQRVRYNRWRVFEQPLAQRTPDTRFIREIFFGQRRSLCYFQITKGTEQSTDSWFIMTDLSGNILRLPLLHSLRFMHSTSVGMP